MDNQPVENGWAQFVAVRESLLAASCNTLTLNAVGPASNAGMLKFSPFGEIFIYVVEENSVETRGEKMDSPTNVGMGKSHRFEECVDGWAV
jgi:hypothetical protein